MSDPLTFVAGVVFGVALAAPPGPMNAVIAKESVTHGWHSGVRAGLGAMTADLCFLCGALLGVVALIGQYPVLRGVMLAIGGVLMLVFAYGAVSDLRTGSGFSVQHEETTGRGFRKAFALAITNPYQVLFWLTIGTALLDPGTVDVLAPLSTSFAGQFVVQTGSPVLLIGLFGGITIWIVGFPAAILTAERRMAVLSPLIAGGSALLLSGFGVYFLVDAFELLSS